MANKNSLKEKSPFAGFLANAVLFIFTIALIVGALELAVRQLRLVNRLHNRASNFFTDSIGYLHKPGIKTTFRFLNYKHNYETNKDRKSVV